MGKIYDKLIGLNRGLFHVTEFKNLESILKNGLLSLDELESQNMEVKYCSSQDSRNIDKHWGLSKYVRLAYTPFYDMIPKSLHAGDLKNPIIILISPEVLKFTGVKFTNKNAISNDAYLSDEDEIFDSLDFEKIYKVRDKNNYFLEEYKNARQSEILIPQKIDIQYFNKIIIQTGIQYNLLNVYNINIVEYDIISYLSI
jgi:hypothetical protein